MAPASQTAPKKDFFDDDDDEGWQDMPVIRDDFADGLDDEDRKKYHYVTPSNRKTENATGNLIDFDDEGHEWREKQDTNESEYTRLRLTEEDENDEVHLRTRYLFDEDKAMTPLSQMQATKNLLTEAQRVAYVGLCALVTQEMARSMKLTKAKELKPAITSLELWALKILGRLYYHMELETAEQKMIESLAEHGVQAFDLAPSLMTTHTVANPEYDPAEARKQETRVLDSKRDVTTSQDPPLTPKSASSGAAPYQTTTNVLAATTTVSVPGVSTSLSAADKDVTLDIRWTVLCDLFLILIADSVYDARSRVLLEQVAAKLGLGWLDVVKFEQRVSEALEIQEGIERMEHGDVIDSRMKAAKRKRYAMVGLATIGGGLVIGLSAGLLAPVIGAGLGAALATVGVSGTTGFLAGAGGAAVITTAGTLTGSSIAARGMARRTQNVRTFALLPLHNNKRVNCIVTVTGFMTSAKDDVRLPFSVLDPVVGDVFSVLWEPEMLGETGNALKILSAEVLSSVGQTLLQTTVMATLMSALQWPILLTKLGYLIDNPWSNALDRARAAGAVLADVLIERHLGVRPITLIGFSLGARLIFYCLLELAKKKAFGIVQDVFILGATLTASRQNWCQARSVVSGRFVNGYARNDWILNYLFRATSGGLSSIAGLRPVQDVPGLENVDVTDKITGHMSYRTFMPLILDQLGFPVSADYFDEPEEPDFEGDRVVVREEQQPQKKSWFSRKSKPTTPKRPASKSGSGSGSGVFKSGSASAKAESEKATIGDDDELPERIEHGKAQGGSVVSSSSPPLATSAGRDELGVEDTHSPVPKHAGFDFKAIHEMLEQEGGNHTPGPVQLPRPNIPPPSHRSESAPPPAYETVAGFGVSAPDQHEAKFRTLGSSSARPSLEDGARSRQDLSNMFARAVSVSGPIPSSSSSTSTSTATAVESKKSHIFGTSDTSTRGLDLPGDATRTGRTEANTITDADDNDNDTDSPESYTYPSASARRAGDMDSMGLGVDTDMDIASSAFAPSHSSGLTFTSLGSTASRSWQPNPPGLGIGVGAVGVDDYRALGGGLGLGTYGSRASRADMTSTSALGASTTSSASARLPELSFGGLDGSVWGVGGDDDGAGDIGASGSGGGGGAAAGGGFGGFGGLGLGFPSTSGRDPLAVLDGASLLSSRGAAGAAAGLPSATASSSYSSYATSAPTPFTPRFGGGGVGVEDTDTDTFPGLPSSSPSSSPSPSGSVSAAARSSSSSGALRIGAGLNSYSNSNNELQLTGRSSLVSTTTLTSTSRMNSVRENTGSDSMGIPHASGISGGIGGIGVGNIDIDTDPIGVSVASSSLGLGSSGFGGSAAATTLSFGTFEGDVTLASSMDESGTGSAGGRDKEQLAWRPPPLGRQDSASSMQQNPWQ